LLELAFLKGGFMTFLPGEKVGKRMEGKDY